MAYNLAHALAPDQSGLDNRLIYSFTKSPKGLGTYPPDPWASCYLLLATAAYQQVELY